MSFEVKAARRVAHSADRVWETLSDHAGYAQVAPTISRVEVLTETGEGMIRRCTDNQGRSWTESCNLWEEGRRFRMDVDTATYPLQLRLLFSRFQGEWAVQPAGQDSEIIVSFEGTLRWGPLGRILQRSLETRGQRLAEEVLDGYEKALASPAPQSK